MHNRQKIIINVILTKRLSSIMPASGHNYKDKDQTKETEH